jgi:hypothetical protein
MKLAGIEPAKLGLVPPQRMPDVLRMPNLLFAPFLKAQNIGRRRDRRWPTISRPGGRPRSIT